MLEAKIIIEAPELANAINNLAAAIGAAKANPAAMVAPAAPHNPAAMVAPAPVANPTPAPAAVPVAPSAPAPSNPQPAPMPGPAPVTNAPVSYPAPGVPLAQPPQYSVDQIMAAGATLMDAGKVNELMALLHSFGVQAVMDLKPEQLGAFATEMRKLGAQI